MLSVIRKEKLFKDKGVVIGDSGFNNVVGKEEVVSKRGVRTRKYAREQSSGSDRQAYLGVQKRDMSEEVKGKFSISNLTPWLREYFYRDTESPGVRFLDLINTHNVFYDRRYSSGTSGGLAVCIDYVWECKGRSVATVLLNSLTLGSQFVNTFDLLLLLKEHTAQQIESGHLLTDARFCTTMTGYMNGLGYVELQLIEALERAMSYKDINILRGSESMRCDFVIHLLRSRDRLSDARDTYTLSSDSHQLTTESLIDANFTRSTIETRALNEYRQHNTETRHTHSSGHMRGTNVVEGVYVSRETLVLSGMIYYNSGDERKSLDTRWTWTDMGVGDTTEWISDMGHIHSIPLRQANADMKVELRLFKESGIDGWGRVFELRGIMIGGVEGFGRVVGVWNVMRVELRDSHGEEAHSNVPGGVVVCAQLVHQCSDHSEVA
ncbi:hypothetical protein Tco_0941044 [Tanacetum coccineum]|uniref:Uncharacterized protein n=1 Tax=Tanacetum coccineum TaxID=301880 RepID=A0ABQ5DQ44_9ASTR